MPSYSGQDFLQLAAHVYADLPDAASYPGMVAYITDASTDVLGEVSVGGGNNKAVVVSTGVDGYIVGMVSGAVGGGGGSGGGGIDVNSVNILDYGARGDGSTITTGDIAANPQWIGVYTAGATWDTVGIQEAIYAAFADLSTPGNVVWNITDANYKLNKKLYVPPGSFSINRQLLMVASFFTIEFAARGIATWNWVGAQDVSMFVCDSIAYGLILNPTFQAQTLVDEPLWKIDGSGAHGGLKTQQLTIINPMINGNVQALRGIAISPAGGGAQGDTITFLNPYVGGFIEYGVSLGGANCLGVSFLGGDFQGNWKNGIACFSGQFYVYGTSFQNQGAGRFISPAQHQIVLAGADIYIYSAPGGNPSGMRDIRSESNVGIMDYSGAGSVMDNVQVLSAGYDDAYRDFPFFPGNVVSPGENNTLNRVFLCVGADVETDWRVPDPSSTTTVIQDPTASFTPNAFVGRALFFRYGSNGFTEHVSIASNTATSITLTDEVGGSSVGLSTSRYRVGGYTGAVAPNFDSLPNGLYADIGDLQSFTTVQNSTTITFGSVIQAAIAVGRYVIIPNADVLDVGEGTRAWRCALIAKVVSAQLATYPFTAVLDKPARFSGDFFGYVSSTLLDNQVLWAHVNLEVIHGAGVLKNASANVGWISRCETYLQVPTASIKTPQTHIGTGTVLPPISAPPALLGYGGVIDLGSGVAGNVFQVLTRSDTIIDAPVPNPSLSEEMFITLEFDTSPLCTVTFRNNFISNGPVVGRSDADDVIGIRRCWLTFRSISSAYGVNRWVEISRDGVPEWMKVSTTFTATWGMKLLADTSGGPFTINLPNSISVGDAIRFRDAIGTWNVNNLTIGRNGRPINGAASDLVLSTLDGDVELVYMGGATGWKTHINS